MLVETATNELFLKFNWPAELLLLATSPHHGRLRLLLFFPQYLRLFWIVDPSLLSLLVEEHDGLQQPI